MSTTPAVVVAPPPQQQNPKYLQQSQIPIIVAVVAL
jgi:hypothetical protein